MTARLLLLSSPPLRGPDVKAAQQALALHGYALKLDGVYAATTAAAVRRFQRQAQLRVDGIVGPATRKALEGPLTPPPAVLPGREPPGWLALQWMLDHVGITEQPPGSNRCPVTAEFGLGPVPWCMETVSLAFKHGANLILGDGPGPHPWGYWPGRGFAYVPAFEAWAKTRGYWIGRVHDPEPGDVACYDWDNDGEPDHVGIVQKSLGAGGFAAAEGNTSIGNDSNGGELLLRDDRHALETAGFARIRWQQP